MTSWTRRLLACAAIASQALAGHALAGQAPGTAGTARSGSTASSAGPMPFLTANGPARLLRITAATQAQAFGFVASAGESLSLQVRSSTAASACDADLIVADSSGRTIARQSCAVGAGQTLAFSTPAAGLYSVRFKVREGAAADLRLALSSPSRMARRAAAPLACDPATLPLDKTASGTWDSTCESVSYAGHYARYYTFTVPVAQVVTVSLGGATDPSLVLHDGPSIEGITIAADSDRGPGHDAQIVMLLTAGTYTVEATTAQATQAGSFTLVARRNVAPCFADIKFNKPAQGQWVKACASQYEDDRYAKYYTFTVPSRRTVSLALHPAEATIPRLILRSGAGQLGAVVRAATPAAVGGDAAMTLSLDAGTYTVEASAYYPAHKGAFTLTVSTTAPCTDTLALDTMVDGSTTDGCFSNLYPGNFARFYTFTVPSLQVVTITMLSPVPNTETFQPVMVLRSGAGPLGTVITFESYDRYTGFAVVRRNFPAGTYTIEVTNEFRLPTDFSLVARTNTAPCFATLAFNTKLSGTWQPTCPAGGGSPYQYSNFYPLSVPTAATYTFNIESSSVQKPHLSLMYGPTQLGLYANEGIRYENGYSKLIADLTPGEYILEVKNGNSGSPTVGDYTFTAAVNGASCLSELALDAPMSAAWSKECASTAVTGGYARYYNVVVKSPQVLTAMLSSPKDTYLVLHDGTDQYAPVLAQDDNSGIGTNAMITKVLTPGTYTFEVTTTTPKQLGNFDFAVRRNTAPCMTPIALGQSVEASWADTCVSPTLDDHYAKFHTFSLPSARTVTIQLTSATDSYLVLRGGPDQQLGPLVASDDNSGGGTNARISMTLPSGTYTIEATTGQAMQQGAYTLQLN
jgi:hypothetical protein